MIAEGLFRSVTDISGMGMGMERSRDRGIERVLANGT